MTREGECETSSLWARGSPSNRGDEIGLYNGTTVLKGATGAREKGSKMPRGGEMVCSGRKQGRLLGGRTLELCWERKFRNR